ncbi:unnamed protein product [Effrenium voratum]|nr:unnamed protein product [Effrenium voratum]
MLRMEIQRLKEQTDTPERLELEIPCERRTGDEDCTALAIAEAGDERDAAEVTFSLAPAPVTLEEGLKSMIAPKVVAFESGVESPGSSAEKRAVEAALQSMSEASDILSQRNRGIDGKAHFEQREVWQTQDLYLMEDEDWSPERYILATKTLKKNKQQNLLARSTKTIEMLPNMNLRAIIRDRRPIPPSAPLRLAWDVFGLTLILYDIIAIPLEAFDWPRSIFQDFMDWTALMFWTGDVIFSFFTGYYHNGQLVLNYRKIALQYLSTWFILDLAVIVPEWLTMAGSDSLHYAGIGRALRLGKAMRVVRLLRVLKLRRILDAMLEYIESEFTFLVISLLRLLFFIVLLNHVIACLWYLIGKESNIAGNVNWIQTGGYLQEDATYKYTTSLHWALTQFTPASMDVSAKNVYERVFSIAVLFFAMVAFSSIVGGVTASMTQLNNLRSNHMKQFWMLRRYLKQNGVNKELQFRIEKFLEYRILKEQEYVQPSMVLHLSKLSQPLRNELAHNIMVQWLRGHPFFLKVSVLMPNFMHKLCSKAINEKVIGSGDIVFEAGEECSQVFFLSAGLVLEYTPLQSKNQNVEETPSYKLQQKQWLSEPALWVHWKHLGVCEAEKPGELLSVDANNFCKEMSAHPAPRALCASYAQLFVECLNNLPRQNLSDVLDQTILDSAALVDKASSVLKTLAEQASQEVL